jgi:hypothetical protein
MAGQNTSIVALRVAEGDENCVWGYNRETLSLEEINTGTCSSIWGAGHKDDDLVL